MPHMLKGIEALENVTASGSRNQKRGSLVGEENSVEQIRGDQQNPVLFWRNVIPSLLYFGTGRRNLDGMIFRKLAGSGTMHRERRDMRP